MPTTNFNELAARSLSASPLLVFHVRANGYFSYTNAAVQHALGYSAAELQEIRAADVLADYSPDERENLRRQIAKKGTATVRAVLRRRDGSTLPVESHNVLLDVDGETVNCAICHNVAKPALGHKPTPNSTIVSVSERPLYAVADELQLVGSSKQMRKVLLTARQYAVGATCPF